MTEEKHTPEEEPQAPEELPDEVQEPLEEAEQFAEEEVTEPAGRWQAEDTTDNDRLMAALAYGSQVVIPVLVPAVMLLAEESKERPFQKFHAAQSLGFLLVAIIYQVLAAIVYCGLSAVTSGCLACVLWVIFLPPVLPAFYYAYLAYQGWYFKIPLLTDFMVQSDWLEVPPAQQ